MDTGLYVQGTSESLDAADTLMHKLKNPLSVIIRTSNAIFNITDLTPEELHEYLRQIRSSAYKMHEIIDHSLLHSQAHKANSR